MFECRDCVCAYTAVYFLICRRQLQPQSSKTLLPRSMFILPTLSRFASSDCTLVIMNQLDLADAISWHAGPPGHQLVADMLFMHYAKVFVRALNRLERAAPGITASELRDSEQTLSIRSLRGTLDLDPGAVVANSGEGEDDLYMGGGRGDILPPPAWCADWAFCSGAGNYRCANSYFPLAGDEKSRLLDMVSDGTPAVLNADHKEYFSEPAAGHWAVTLNEEAPNLISYFGMAPPDGFHHPIDMKWVLVGDAASGPIEFEFETIGVPPEQGGGALVAEEEESEGLGEEENGDAEVGEVQKGGQRVVEEEWEGQPTEKENGEGRGRRRVTGERQNSVPQGSQVVVCKPDFIDRRNLTDSTQVRFRLDGAEVSAGGLAQSFMKQGSCITLEAEVGVGRHMVTVEPLQSGMPYVAISHLLYPA